MTEHEVPVPTLAELEQMQAEHAAGEGEAGDRMPQPEVIGEGWSAVVVLPMGAAGLGAAGDDTAGGLDPEASALLGSLTESVEGGRVLHTSLATVLLTDDGRVLAGAVTADRLLDAAASGR
ncbi:hypothetical protein [Agromyces sp. Root81]|uniref:hypothetical protein n=1 Tax=Agromyces sp. Root81 TaxID=1736601 RepID=UPI000A912C91|nr:hypothetical protein [Agromyces sp. Root81]